MHRVPSMVTPSAASTAVFVSIVLGLCAALVLGVWRADKSLGETPRQSRRAALHAALGVGGWLVLTGVASASGVLERQVLPPPLALFAIGSLVSAVFLARSGLGTRLVNGLPIAALIGVQAFRLPLELVLHAWKNQGVIPVQMTFEGHNFDIVSGVLALGLCVWLQRGQPPRAAIWAFNLIGSALLLVVIAIAVLSSPLPIRHYTNDPALLLAFHFPYGYIIPVCVAGALFGHVLVFRWLHATAKQSASAGGRAASRASVGLFTSP